MNLQGMRLSQNQRDSDIHVLQAHPTGCYSSLLLTFAFITFVFCVSTTVVYLFLLAPIESS